MACLRESSITGRVGIVQCDEEGCEFRREQVGGPVYAPGDTSTGDCLLQLRLRAGDTEESGYTCKTCKSRYWCHDEDLCKGVLTKEQSGEIISALIGVRIKELRGE